MIGGPLHAEAWAMIGDVLHAEAWWAMIEDVLHAETWAMIGDVLYAETWVMIQRRPHALSVGHPVQIQSWVLTPAPVGQSNLASKSGENLILSGWEVNRMKGLLKKYSSVTCITCMLKSVASNLPRGCEGDFLSDFQQVLHLSLSAPKLRPSVFFPRIPVN